MILVSAGHGPVDRGAVHEGFAEHDEACIWRDLIVARGGELGRVAFRAVPPARLTQKVAYVNASCADERPVVCIAIEIHFNAGGVVGKTCGCETLYHPGSSRGAVLAQIVQEAIVPYFPPDRGIKEAWYRQDHPHRVDFPGDIDGDEKPDYFCARTVCPAVIVEPEFIYHRERIQSRRADVCTDLAGALLRAHELFNPQE